MKAVTKTITREFDDKGNIIKEIEVIEERYVQDHGIQYIPYPVSPTTPVYPSYPIYKWEITC